MTPYSGLLFCTATMLLLLALFSSQQRHQQVAYWFGWLMLTAAIYCFGYGMELASSTPQQVKLWLHFQYLGVAYIPALILLTAICYQNQHQAPTGLVVFLLALGTLTLAMHWSNDSHHLFYQTQHPIWVNGLAISQLEFGPWYYVHLISTNLALLISCLLFYRVWRVSEQYYRSPALLILLGSLAPWCCYLLYLLGLSPDGIDSSPFGFIVSGPLFAWGLFRYRLVNLLPIARERVFDELTDVVLVLDKNQRIVDFNAQARVQFPQLSPHAIGQPLSTLAPFLFRQLSAQEKRTTPFYEQQHWFELHRHPLQNKGQQRIGEALVLRDVTEQQRLHQQLKLHAEVDALTGLLNRRMILGFLETKLQRAAADSTFALLIFDIDHFKQFNDCRGHLAGDAPLASLAPALRLQLPGEALFGRYGGDEFLVLLPCMTESAALTLATHLNRQSQHQFAVSLSLGVAQWHAGMSDTELLHKADNALYLSKQRGRAQAAAYSDIENSAADASVEIAEFNR